MLWRTKLQISSTGLHIIAMTLMFCDHLWAMLLPTEEWLTCIGRIAFPIFAFMIAEGYLHTHDLRRYLLRIFVWALISEIPFDLMCGGTAFYPYHQNVLWTFLLSLLLIALIEKIKLLFQPAVAVSASVVLVLFGFIFGYVTIVDYYGVGVLTVFVFYYFQGRNWKNRFFQFLCLYILNVELLGGYCYVIPIFGHDIEVVQQSFALLALIPIWLYQGRKGVYCKAFQYFCYAFYPAHLLLLFLARAWMSR